MERCWCGHLIKGDPSQTHAVLTERGQILEQGVHAVDGKAVSRALGLDLLLRILRAESRRYD
jgi:hypothetical protein